MKQDVDIAIKFQEENNDLKYMQLALKEAMKAYKNGVVPVGCVIVKDGVVIARAHNLKEKTNDPMGRGRRPALSGADSGDPGSSGTSNFFIFYQAYWNGFKKQ